MHGHTPVCGLKTLYRLECGAGGVFDTFPVRHSLSDVAGSVNAGPPRLVWETYIIGVGIAVKEFEVPEGGSLSVSEVYHRLKLGLGSHAGSKHNHVHINRYLFAQDGIMHLDSQALVRIFTYRLDLTPAQEDTGVILG